MKHQLVISILIPVLTFSLVGSVNAGRQRLSKPSQREFEPRATTYLLGAKFYAGSVTGEGADEIKKWSSDFSDRMVYGLGLFGDYRIVSSIMVGVTGEYGWKTPVVTEMEAIKYYSYAGTLTYTLRPENRSTLYARSEFGFTHFKYEDNDLGTHSYLRFGLGQVYATAPTTAARFEFYYKHHFSEGHELTGTSGIPFSEIPFNIDWIGFEISFLFGL